MVLTLLETLLLPLVPLFLLSGLALWIKSRRVRLQNDQITELHHQIDKPDTRENSIELTEFLYDFKNRGYSFTRIDPNEVFWRSPKK